MIESPLLQKMSAERIHDLILAVLKDRFESIPRDTVKRLREVLDEKKPCQLNRLAARCPDLDAFRDALPS